MANEYGGFSLPSFNGGNALGDATSVFGNTNLSTVNTGISDGSFQLPNFGADGQFDISSLMQSKTGLGSNGLFQNGLGGQTTQGIGLDDSTDFFSADAMKLGSLGINAFSGLVGAYTGLSNLSLAKDQFKYNKQLSNTNLSNSANLTNERLATRQATRMKSSGITDQATIDAGVSDYMAKYGVSGKVGG